MLKHLQFGTERSFLFFNAGCLLAPQQVPALPVHPTPAPAHMQCQYTQKSPPSSQRLHLRVAVLTPAEVGHADARQPRTAGSGTG